MVARVIIGKHPDTTEKGIWVSVPNSDARTSVDLEDFLVNSSKTNLVPVMAGVITKPKLPRISSESSDASAGDKVNAAAEPSGGYATYWKDYFHNLNYVPVCFFSIATDVNGEIYPSIQVYTDKIRLYHRRMLEKSNQTAIDWGENGMFRPNYVGIGLKCERPSQIEYECTIHYTLYRQPVLVS